MASTPCSRQSRCRNGVPVATVGVGTRRNAAILAAQILVLSDPEIAQRSRPSRAARRKVEQDPTNQPG